MAAEHIYGDLPRNWRLLELSELLEAGIATLQTGPFGTMLHASSYREFGTPVVAVQHIGENRLVDHNLPRVDDETRQRLERYELHENDILFGRKGAVDRRALIRKSEAGWLQGSDCIRLRLAADTIDPVFISYVLGAKQYKNWIVRNAHGATMPSLNQEIISRIPLPLPPLPEQKRIAHILGTLDDKIELNRRMNETLEAMARALFKSWFVDFDPVRAKAAGKQPEGMDAETAALFPSEFVDSALGKIPKGWRVANILEIADLISGGTPRTEVEEYWNGDIFWASAKDVSQCSASFLLKTERSITQRGLEESSTKIVPANSTVVVARGATTGRHCMFGADIAMNQTCYALRSKTGFDFFLFLLFSATVDFLVHAAHGSVFDTITTATFDSGAIVSPSDEILRVFEGQVSPLFGCMKCNLREADCAAAIRDALLPKLLSGEILVA